MRIRFGGPEIRVSWARTAGALYDLVQSGEYLPERGRPKSAQLNFFDVIEDISESVATQENTADETAADLFNDDDGNDGGGFASAPEPLTAPVFPGASKPPNFRITPDLDISGGAKTKYRRNADAIRLLRTIESENRYATPEEQITLAQYSGWGGVSDAFTDNMPGWEREHAELKELLTEEEYRAAASSTLTAHYTAPEVIEGIYAAIDRLGFRGGNVLEPSMGVGNFYGCMPEEIAANSRLYGVELDSITGRVAR